MEAMEAIEADDPKQLAEELGDLLLQVLMHTHMAEEAGTFTLEDVIYGIATKLIRRHPHVFGERHLQSPQEALQQ
jgi:tetrapyrrole methylase family protein/MazG family protein